MDRKEINETEEQMARQISSLLTDNAQHLRTDTLQRLANARKLAVGRLSAKQIQTTQQNGNVLVWFGDNIGQYFGHHRAMSAAMLAGVMVLTFFVSQQFSNNNLENSDAFLLASELPPEAFADKGFDTWLESKVD
ncbi:MAG: DUF3619 family protein [Methylotenera sp.]|nr:DUF3619 family protein [Methylotenera sp.]